MKKCTLLCSLFLILSSITFSQVFEWQNPLPQGNKLWSGSFCDTSTGFLVGENGTIIKTTDGGTSWHLIRKVEDDYIYSVACLNSQTAIIGGSNSHLQKTTDGGETWTKFSFGQQFHTFMSMVFPDDSTGYCIQTSSRILKTTDTGNTWFEVYRNDDITFQSIDFINSQAGMAISAYYIYKTLDGGISWIKQNSEVFDYQLMDIDFVNSSVGYIAAREVVLKSIDGGTTWNEQEYDTTDNFSAGSISFIDENAGCVSTYDGRVYSTTDGGLHWQLINTNENSILLWDTFHNGENAFFSIGEAGIIFKTPVADTIATRLSKVTHNDLNSVCFTKSNHGYAVGNKGVILQTTDQGNTWIKYDSVTSCHLNSVVFITDSIGFIAGTQGTILKTIDAGNEWVIKRAYTYQNYYSIYFVDSMIGYAAGSHGSLDKTINGGDNWTMLVTPTTKSLRHICFLDADTGYIVGWDGLILKTVDGGASFIDQSLTINTDEVDQWFNYLHFTDADNGIAFGSDYVFETNAGHYYVYSTNDGGNTWTATPSNVNYGTAFFIDDNTAFATSNMDLYQSNNGGRTWKKMEHSNTTYTSSMYFINDTIGFLVGWNGSIVKVNVNKEPVIIDEPVITEIHDLLVYPNPAKTEFTLVFDSKIETQGYLEFVDIMGKKIDAQTISVVVGENHVTYNNEKLNNGIYIISLTANSQLFRKKIVVN